MKNKVIFLNIMLFLCVVHGLWAMQNPLAAKKRTHYDALYTDLLHQLATKSYAPASDVVISLLRNRADPAVTTPYGRSLLHQAALHGDLDVATAALDADANPNSRASLDHETPLMLAKTGAMAQLLIARRANVHELNHLKRSILQTAVFNGTDEAPEVSALLCNAGIHVNYQDTFGNTALHDLFLCTAPKTETLQKQTAILLFKGADLSIQNVSRKVPLDVLQKEWPKKVPAVQAVIAAAPMVKKQQEDIYRKVLEEEVTPVLYMHLRKPEIALAIDYANSPPWQTAVCWPLFQEYMKKQRKTS